MLENSCCCRKSQICSGLDQVQGNEIQLKVCGWKAEACEDGSLDADTRCWEHRSS